jgi:hypothetical protein
MPNDAREAERAWWPGDFASATGGSSAPAADDRLRSRASTPPTAGTKLEALRELAPVKSPGRAKLSARVSPATLGQGDPSLYFVFMNGDLVLS